MSRGHLVQRRARRMLRANAAWTFSACNPDLIWDQPVESRQSQAIRGVFDGCCNWDWLVTTRSTGARSRLSTGVTINAGENTAPHQAASRPLSVSGWTAATTLHQCHTASI